MSDVDKRLIEANIKLQDENSNLKFLLSENKKILEQVKTYIQINKDENNKISVEGIFEILGENYE